MPFNPSVLLNKKSLAVLALVALLLASVFGFKDKACDLAKSLSADAHQFFCVEEAVVNA